MREKNRTAAQNGRRKGVGVGDRELDSLVLHVLRACLARCFLAFALINRKAVNRLAKNNLDADLHGFNTEHVVRKLISIKSSAVANASNVYGA